MQLSSQHTAEHQKEIEPVTRKLAAKGISMLTAKDRAITSTQPITKKNQINQLRESLLREVNDNKLTTP